MPKDNASAVLEIKDVDNALKHYQQIAERINYLFDLIVDQVGGAWAHDGVGTCNDSPENFGHGLRGSLAIELPRVWQGVAMLLGEESLESGKCSYHVSGKGCALRAFKPLTCITHIEQSDSDLYKIIGMRKNSLRGFLTVALERAMDGADLDILDETQQRLEGIIQVAENSRFQRRL